MIATDDAPLQDLFKRIEQHILSRLFGRLTQRQQHDEKRDVSGAGIQGLPIRPGRRAGRPLVRQD